MLMMWESAVKCMINSPLASGGWKDKTQNQTAAATARNAQTGDTDDVKKKVAGRWALQKKPTLDQANLKWILEVVGPTG